MIQCKSLLCVVQIIFLILLQSSNCIAGQRTLLYHADPSTRYQTTYKTVYVDSTMECTTACRMEDTCRAISYESITGTCELNDKNHPLARNVDPASMAGWVSFYTNLAAACSPGWTDYSSSFYMTDTTPRDWVSSESNCRGLGGHLVDIHDDNERLFVESIRSGANVWIGLNDRDQAGTWVWSSSASYSYNAFNNPNGPGGGSAKDCIVQMGNGQWKEFKCSSNYYSVCEKDIN